LKGFKKSLFFPVFLDSPKNVPAYSQVWSFVLSVHDLSVAYSQWHFDAYDPHGVQFKWRLCALPLATNAVGRLTRRVNSKARKVVLMLLAVLIL